MNYLDDIKKFCLRYVNDYNPEKCRMALQQIIKFINDEEKNYELREQHRKDLGMKI